MYICIQYHKQTRTNIYNCLGISVSDLRVFATLAIRYLSFFVSIFFSFLFPLSLCLVACLSIGLSLCGWIGCLFIFFLIPFFSLFLSGCFFANFVYHLTPLSLSLSSLSSVTPWPFLSFCLYVFLFIYLSPLNHTLSVNLSVSIYPFFFLFLSTSLSSKPFPFHSQLFSRILFRTDEYAMDTQTYACDGSNKHFCMESSSIRNKEITSK